MVRCARRLLGEPSRSLAKESKSEVRVPPAVALGFKEEERGGGAKALEGERCGAKALNLAVGLSSAAC